MTVTELRDWAETQQADATVEFVLEECAKAHAYNPYATMKNGGWVELEGRYLRVSREHPDRKPAQVAEKLLK